MCVQDTIWSMLAATPGVCSAVQRPVTEFNDPKDPGAAPINPGRSIACPVVTVDADVSDGKSLANAWAANFPILGGTVVAGRQPAVRPGCSLFR